MFYEVAEESDLSVDVRTSETSRMYIFIYFLTNRESIQSLKDETFLISHNIYYCNFEISFLHCTNIIKKSK